MPVSSTVTVKGKLVHGKLVHRKLNPAENRSTDVVKLVHGKLVFNSITHHYEDHFYEYICPMQYMDAC